MNLYLFNRLKSYASAEFMTGYEESPLLIRLKNIAEDPCSVEDPFEVVNSQVSRIEKSLNNMKFCGKLKTVDEFTGKTKSAFNKFLTAWKTLQLCLEKCLFKIEDITIDKIKDTIDADKLDLLEKLNYKKFSKEDLKKTLFQMDLNEDIIDAILKYSVKIYPDDKKIKNLINEAVNMASIADKQLDDIEKAQKEIIKSNPIVA